METLATAAAVLFVLLVVLKPLGTYLANVFTFRPTILDPVWGRVESWLFQEMGVGGQRTESVRQYVAAMLVTNGVLVGLGAALLLVQPLLRGITPGAPTLSPLSAFFLAVRLGQGAGPGIAVTSHTFSYWQQFGGVAVLQFAAAATAGAAAMAFMRAMAGKPWGNFFVDLTLMCTRVLLPLAAVAALLLVWQGVPDFLGGGAPIHLLTGGTSVVPRGPLASGTAAGAVSQAGGIVPAGAANPLTNPTPVSNLIILLSMAVLPVSFFYAFGAMTGRRRMAWSLIAVAGLLLLGMVALGLAAETAGNPLLASLHLSGTPNWVGKDLRFGLGGTVLTEMSSSAFGAGLPIASHPSLLPLSSLAVLAGRLLGLVFGQTGLGFLNMMTFVVLTVFVAGLMVGRTPELLGKKIESRELLLAAGAFLIRPALILGGVVGTLLPRLIAEADPLSASRFSALLYQWALAASSSGSGVSSTGGTVAQGALALTTIVARYGPMVMMLWLADSLASKRATPESAGTLRTDDALFSGILLTTVLVVNALTFFPVVALGPVTEHYLIFMHRQI